MLKKVLIVTIIGALLFLVFNIIQENFLHNPNKFPPQINEPLSDTVVSVQSYQVYDLEDVPFRFIIAKITITTNKSPLHFDLYRFKTDEGIYLNDLDQYKSEVSLKGYDLTKQSVTTDLSSTNNSVNVTIFIPVLNYYRQNLTVTVSGLNNSKLKFFLNNPTGSAQDLGKTIVVSQEVIPSTTLEPKTEEVVPSTDKNSESIYVNALNEIDKDLVFYRVNDNEVRRVNFSNRSSLVLTNINFDYSEPVKILAARINYQDGKYLFFALDQHYMTQHSKNILNEEIATGKGVLIFQIDQVFLDVLNDPYQIEIKLSSDNQWHVFEFNN